MAIVSVSVPDELKKRMDEEDETNWSAIARGAFEKRLELSKLIQKAQQELDITEEDAIRMGRELKARAHKHFRENST